MNVPALLLTALCSTYALLPRMAPQRMMVHVVDVELDNASFLVTPPEWDGSLAARTTSQFLYEFNLDAAINGDGFSPWWDRGPLDYYPHPGDRVTVPGFAATQGLIYSSGSSENTLFIGQDNHVSFGAPVGPVYNAISGQRILLRDGVAIRVDNPALHPRTAVGLSCDETTLILMVIDGRQRTSAGAAINDVTDLMLEQGACDALLLDGGGTSTLVMEGRAVNSPIHAGVRGLERPGANHLGVDCR